jgi:hypothetical protein
LDALLLEELESRGDLDAVAAWRLKLQDRRENRRRFAGLHRRFNGGS